MVQDQEPLEEAEQEVLDLEKMEALVDSQILRAQQYIMQAVEGQEMAAATELVQTITVVAVVVEQADLVLL
jgi:hypothetical protein